MAAGDKTQGWAVCSQVATTDATQTTLASYTVGEDCTVVANVLVVAQHYDNNQHANAFSGVYHLLANCASGTATLRDSTIIDELDPATTNWAVAFDADGATIRVRVTGTAGEDVRWAARIDVLQVEQEVPVV